MHLSVVMPASYEVGDTTERRLPEALVADDTGEFVRPRSFPRPSSMYPMVSIEDEPEEDSRPTDDADRQYMTASVAWPP